MTDFKYPKIAAKHSPPGTGEFTADRDQLIRWRLELENVQLNGVSVTACWLWDLVAALVPEMDLMNGFLKANAQESAVRDEKCRRKAEIREVLEELMAEKGIR